MKINANYITATRVVAACPMFSLICFYGRTPMEQAWFLHLAVYLAIFAEITDALDGWVARSKYGQITEVGEWFDPFADRTYHLATFLAFWLMGWLWWGLLVVFVVREAISVLYRRVMKKTGRRLSARGWGKAKTASQAVAQIAVLYMQACAFEGVLSPGNATFWGNVLLAVSGVITAYSGWAYIRYMLEATSTLKPAVDAEAEA